MKSTQEIHTLVECAASMPLEVRVDILKLLERIVGSDHCRPGHVAYYSRTDITESARQILEFLEVGS